MSIYEKRIAQLRTMMVDNQIDAFFVMMSSDMQYLTGVLRQPHNPTDDNKHGDVIYGMYISLSEGPFFVVPRMGGAPYLRAQAQGKPWVKDVFVINDGVCSFCQDVREFTKDILVKLGCPKTLAVCGRTWLSSIETFKAASPSLQIKDGSKLLAVMRMIKDETEIAIMQEAGRITDRVFAAVLKQMRLGMTEYDLVREVDHQIVIQGGQWTSFHTTAKVRGDALRPLSANNGYTPATPLQPGAVVAFDFGLIYQGYVSDFGRTVFCGSPNPQYLHYHDLIMQSQAEAIAAMKAEQITTAQLNEVARRVLDEAEVGQYFTHRLGHGIGIDVHEEPFLYPMDQTILQNGMCFTIEPSIRLPNEVMIRVEDVVMVTPEGGQPFSKFSKEYLII